MKTKPIPAIIGGKTKKRGRNAEHYHDSDGRPIEGLARRPSDGRWRIIGTPITFVERDEARAIARFRHWQQQNDQVPVGAAGWGCCRKANDNIGIPPGTVVLLTLMGYGPANIVDGYQLNGVATVEGRGQPLAAPDGKVPFYTFQYNMVQQTSILPLHDHRDNVAGGGFAFAVYHPGTSLPAQPWSM